MKKLSLLLSILLLNGILIAQTTGLPAIDKHSKNAAYAEFLGNGFAYSLNYERLLLQDNIMSIRARAGISAGFLNIFTGVGLPLELNFAFLEKNGHALECGTGFAWFNGKSSYRNKDRELVSSSRYNVCDINLRVGYRYQKPGNGLVLRAGFLPVFAVVSPPEVRNNSFFPFGKTFTPWGGISVGYAFGK